MFEPETPKERIGFAYVETPNNDNNLTEQPELVDTTGRLLVKGCYDSVPGRFSRERIPGLRRFGSLTEAEEYAVFADHLHLYFSIFEHGVAALLAVTVIDCRNKREKTYFQTVPISLGSTELPADVGGDVMLRYKDCSLDFAHSQEARYIRCRIEHFDDVRTLYVNLALQSLPENKLFAARELGESSGFFTCSGRLPCSRVSGVVVLGAERYELSEQSCFSSYSWDRAVMQKQYSLLRLTALGLHNERNFGISVGTDGGCIQQGDSVELTGHVSLRFSREKPMQPIAVRTADRRMNMTFSPERLRYDRKSFPGLLSFERQLVFGSISGTYRLQDDTVIKTESIPTVLCSMKI